MMTDDTAGTQIGRLYQTLVQKEQPVTGLSDEARADRNDEITRMVGSLVRLPAAGLEDVAAKLAVLCARLRAEDCGVTSPNGALTALLAESARDDLGRLILRGAVQGAAWHIVSRHYDTPIGGWLRQGYTIKEAQTFAGHASAQMTIDRYGHYLPKGDQHSGMNKIFQSVLMQHPRNTTE